MINTKVHFGNNNTLNIKLHEQLETSELTKLITIIINKHETDVLHLIIDGTLVSDLDNTISEYLQESDVHTVHIIFKYPNVTYAPSDLLMNHALIQAQSPMQLLETIVESFNRPVLIVIDNPTEYMTETSAHYGESCPYCLQEMTDDPSDRIVMLNTCHHVFHAHCISGWLSRVNVYCPSCNTDVRAGDMLSPDIVLSTT